MTRITLTHWPANPGGWTAPRLDLGAVRRALAVDLGTEVVDGLDHLGRVTLTAAVTHERLIEAARIFLEPHGVEVLT